MLPWAQKHEVLGLGIQLRLQSACLTCTSPGYCTYQVYWHIPHDYLGAGGSGVKAVFVYEQAQLWLRWHETEKKKYKV